MASLTVMSLVWASMVPPPSLSCGGDGAAGSFVFCFLVVLLGAVVAAPPATLSDTSFVVLRGSLEEVVPLSSGVFSSPVMARVLGIGLCCSEGFVLLCEV